MTDAQLRIDGLRLLVQGLGDVAAEKFISLMLREPFDYTKWQASLWPEKSVKDLSSAAMAIRSNNSSAV